jgi:receptor protein-tyrosine kinase
MQMPVKNSTPLGDRSIGAILVDRGKLSIEDVDWILHLQKAENLRFGEAAIKLGLLRQEDIQFALARQFDYPYLAKGESGISDELVAAYQPHSPQVESLRALRSQLMLRWLSGESGSNALAVVSPMRGEGRTYLAANLAIVFSQLGERTLLIDGDMRNPRLDNLFKLENRVGLSDIVARRGQVSEAIERIPSFVDLSVMSAGTVFTNPQDLLARNLFGDLLEEFGREFAVILIDTPAGVEGADAQTIAVRAGAALLAVRKHQSRLDVLQSFVGSLSDSRVSMVGSVISEY